MKYFGSSGIRGIYGEMVTPDFFQKLGKCLGIMGGPVALGMDHRKTSNLLASALSSGVLSTGQDVLDLGLVPTPTTAFWAGKAKMGAMVTASHNPPEYNGIKLWNPSGLAFVNEQMEKVETLIDRGDYPQSPWDRVGRRTVRDDAVARHAEAIVRNIHLERPISVVIDCGNGSTSTISPLVLQDIGCEVFKLNCSIDPYFHSRPSEPTEEALTGLIRKVIETGADLGIAHDGDGDRMVAVNSQGEFIGGEKLMQTFASSPEITRITTPVNASMAVEEIVGKENITRTRVGDVFVGEALQEKGGELGCEPSGTWIFPEFSLAPDGIYAAAKLVELVSREGKEILEGHKDPPRQKLKMPLKEGKEETMQKVETVLKSTPHSGIDRLDGVRADFEWGWILIRPSGTEPIIRVTAEARDEKHLMENAQPLVEKIRKAIQ